jgi:MCP family monocarboxylic acid transporter-like MFS transporter 10
VKDNKAFWWFTAAVAFMFFGFYPVFFNIEEVSTNLLATNGIS